MKISRPLSWLYEAIIIIVKLVSVVSPWEKQYHREKKLTEELKSEEKINKFVYELVRYDEMRMN